MHFDRKRRFADCAALLTVGALTLLFAGCASIVLTPEHEPQFPTQWHERSPHGGRSADLRQWWSQFDDPLLPRLIELAQQVSPTLAKADANIADARALSVASGAALLPSLGATASATRGRAELATSAANVTSLGLDATWELDLSGASRAGLSAARARLVATQANWHDARVSVAAEVARNYIELRACEAHVELNRVDAASRAQTSHLTMLAVAGGVRSIATADLALASAAQAEATLEERKAQCDLLVKVLVALTAQDELSLRRELAEKTAQVPQPAEFGVHAVPAEVLAQRPDLHVAAREVAAASADATQAQAQRWPRITLAGSIGATRMSSLGVRSDGAVWSVGPVAITFPLFDGGVRQANAKAARVRYEAATAAYAGRVRTAVQEVEGALVTLGSTARRSERARAANEGMERSYRATAAGYDAGASSLFDLEDARRSLIATQGALIDLHRERLLAWVSLYRSVGGDWSTPSDNVLAGSRQPMTQPNHIPTASCSGACGSGYPEFKTSLPGNDHENIR